MHFAFLVTFTDKGERVSTVLFLLTLPPPPEFTGCRGLVGNLPRARYPPEVANQWFPHREKMKVTEIRFDD